MKNYTLLLCILLYFSFMRTMDDILVEYHLPESAGDGIIGGLITLKHDVFGGKFKKNEKVASFQVLKLRINTHSPEVIRKRFIAKYKKTIADLEMLNIENYLTLPDYLLMQEIGRRLNLIDANGNLIEYAAPSDISNHPFIPPMGYEDVEADATNQAGEEILFQENQFEEYQETWLDHWLTPGFVRYVYRMMWTNE